MKYLVAGLICQHNTRGQVVSQRVQDATCPILFKDGAWCSKFNCGLAIQFLFSLTSVTSAGCFGDYFFVDFSVLCVLKYLYFWQLPGGEALDKRIFPFERRVGLLLGGGSRHDTRQLDGCPQFEPSLATFGPVRNRALWFTS